MDNEFSRAYDISQCQFPKSTSKFYQYGTSGFREKANELNFITFRMGILAVLRSKAKQGSTVGLMITASHNPEEDNGIKLCDPTGDMLEHEWEKLATQLVNSMDEEFVDILKSIASSIDYSMPSNVFIGHDTRSSSELLLDCAVSGIKAVNGKYESFGLVTTPQLHYLVCCKNDSSYGDPSLEGYYRKFSSAFERLLSFEDKERSPASLYVDGANGVGAHKMRELLPYIKSLNVKIFNDKTSGKLLNYKCGADFVKIEQKPPEGLPHEILTKYASLDGDADRIVYFYFDKDSVFHLLDGDKIATLIAYYLQDLINKIGLNLSMRIIQTAYANGMSTSYMSETLKVPVICVPTGVKYLHHEAKKYDVGIYFEANGHGTVVFSQQAKSSLKSFVADESISDIQKMDAQRLLATIDCINETVGDAISDLLVVEAILCYYNWSIEQWDKMYEDRPCRQLKVKVSDKNSVVTTNAERTCVKPEGLQEAIDKAVTQYASARAFIRPSGTENIVRVYAEASTQESADMLAKDVSMLIQKFVG